MTELPNNPIPRHRRTGWRAVAGLAGFVLLCLAVSAIGGWFTAQSVDGWYQTLAKPPFNPPDGVFAPVWIALYISMGIAAWLVWRRAGFTGARRALGLFLIQLALNLLWTIFFFGLKAPGLALIEILLLLAAIAGTIRAFAPIDRTAAWLLVPYLAWVAFAALLNGAIWWLNRI
ncbi:MAG: TspO/MBR family protein [Rhodospirillaceae bacterium]|nr:TspO/MBR family protein [Rhodospirillaceae bacterium]